MCDTQAADVAHLLRSMTFGSALQQSRMHKILDFSIIIISMYLFQPSRVDQMPGHHMMGQLLHHRLCWDTHQQTWQH